MDVDADGQWGLPDVLNQISNMHDVADNVLELKRFGAVQV